MQNMTQQEFIRRIDMLKRTLTNAWNENQKVKALKIAIQVRCNNVTFLLVILSPNHSENFVCIFPKSC